MIFIAILIGCILGALIGMNAPMISYTYSSYLAIAIIAALDSVFGGITSVINKNFDLKIFVTGFFGNAILSINNIGTEVKCRYLFSSNCCICRKNVCKFSDYKKILCR